MSSKDAIREAVEAFVEELKGIIEQSALESVRSLLDASSSSTGRAPKATRAAVTTAGTRRGKGAKRAPEELEALTKKLRTFIAKNPGQRVEQIGKSLDMPTKELALPIKKLIAEKQIGTKGQKRATTYFPK